MSDHTHLPELPLMLAGVPLAVAESLRAAGLPALELPRVPLSAAGVGRFVLFDSRSKRSAAQARRAAREGLVLLDLHDLCDSIDRQELEQSPAVCAASPAVRLFLSRIKSELERQGGFWVCVGEWPHPFQSALCVGIEHAADLARFETIAASYPSPVTHFVSSLLRGDELIPLSRSAKIETGWRILPEDCQGSCRGTLSHWATRIERFRAVGRAPSGLLVGRSDVTLPDSRRLTALGLGYCCQRRTAGSFLPEVSESEPSGEWMRFGATAPPHADEASQWPRSRHRGGRSSFVVASADELAPLGALLSAAGHAASSPLTWQTSFARFARWSRLQRRIRLEVWRRNGGCEIHAEGEFAEGPWTIEIWRGEHRAMVPMFRPELHVPDDGLVYQKAASSPPLGRAMPSDESLCGLPPPEEEQRLAA